MIRVTAHAKINLFLEITGKRADGYHTLSTVFQTISLGDELTFSAADELSLTCSDPSLPVDSSNLVMKAAFRLQEALREPRGAKIHLEKRVPMGAGLGGGSSDAAAVLLTLLKLWKRKMPSADLAQLAVKLGADVPFFLRGGLCLASGIGDELTSLKPLPQTWLVLVYPGFGVATKEAYQWMKLPFSDTRAVQRSQMTKNLFNRFEEFVFPGHPELSLVKKTLLDAGAIASLMSGSGSSVFGLVSSQQQGEATLERLRKKYPHCWLVSTI